MIIFAAILHEGDILACGTDSELKLFDELIRKFEAGGAVYSDQSLQMVFCGVELDFSRNPSIGISQNSYRGSFLPLYQVDFLGPKRAHRTPGQIAKAGEKFVGSATWMGLTRFGICFLTAKCATLLPLAAVSELKLKGFLPTASALYRVIVSKELTIWYHSFADLPLR